MIGDLVNSSDSISGMMASHRQTRARQPCDQICIFERVSAV